ncbi:MAG: 30S ribosomal protein S16 [Candidatus Omnitrophota bacterium]
MAVHIRLRKIGKNPKNNPHFRISIYEKTINRDGRSIEDIGFYDPITGEVKLKKDRFDLWIKKGAKATETVKSLARKVGKNASTNS